MTTTEDKMFTPTGALMMRDRLANPGLDSDATVNGWLANDRVIERELSEIWRGLEMLCANGLDARTRRETAAVIRDRSFRALRRAAALGVSLGGAE